MIWAFGKSLYQRSLYQRTFNNSGVSKVQSDQVQKCIDYNCFIKYHLPLVCSHTDISLRQHLQPTALPWLQTLHLLMGPAWPPGPGNSHHIDVDIIIPPASTCHHTSSAKHAILPWRLPSFSCHRSSSL